MKRVAALIALVTLSLPRAVSGQDLTSRPIQPTETFRFDSGSGVGAAWGGVQIGPYNGTLLSDPTHPSLTLYCVDFAHGIRSGKVVNVNTTKVGDDLADLSETRLARDPSSAFGSGPMATVDARLMKYRRAAFLTSLFESYAAQGSRAVDLDQDGTTDTTLAGLGGNLRRNAWSGIHAAIWSIMTPGFPASDLADPDLTLAIALAEPFIKAAQDAADSGFVGFDFSGYSVLTDVRARGHRRGRQEYLVRTNVVPEPATVILMLTGLIVLGGLGRRRFRELGERSEV